MNTPRYGYIMNLIFWPWHTYFQWKEIVSCKISRQSQASDGLAIEPPSPKIVCGWIEEFPKQSIYCYNGCTTQYIGYDHNPLWKSPSTRHCNRISMEKVLKRFLDLGWPWQSSAPVKTLGLEVLLEITRGLVGMWVLFWVGDKSQNHLPVKILSITSIVRVRTWWKIIPCWCFFGVNHPRKYLADSCNLSKKTHSFRWTVPRQFQISTPVTSHPSTSSTCPLHSLQHIETWGMLW